MATVSAPPASWVNKGSCCATAASLDTRDRDVTGNMHKKLIKHEDWRQLQYVAASLLFFFLAHKKMLNDLVGCLK